MYCINPESDEPILLIDKHIGFDSEDGQGIDGSLFAQELLSLDGLGKKVIKVWINSPGGVVTDGYSIFNAILKTKTKVDTYCTGCAASIAGVIFLAGRNRIMSDYSWLMYHLPFGGDDKSLNLITDSLIRMVCSRTGKSEDFIKKMLTRETFILADEAYDMGFCTEVENSEDHNKKRLAGADTVKAKWEVGNKILNHAISKIKNQNNSNIMDIAEYKSEFTAITNRLGLRKDATGDSIIAAITDIQNKAKKEVDEAKDEMDKAINARKEKDAEYDKLVKDLKDKEEDLKDCKDRLAKMKQEREEEEAKNKAKKEKDEDEEAEEMAKNYAKIGRIKNEDTEILRWKNTIKKLGKTEAKELIEALPLNKAMPFVHIENKDSGKVIPISAEAMMRDLARKTKSQA